MDNKNNKIIEEYFKRHKIEYIKDHMIYNTKVDYWIPKSKFVVLIKGTNNSKNKYMSLKMHKDITKVIYFIPKWKNDLTKAFEGCGAEYIKTGQRGNLNQGIKEPTERIYEYAERMRNNPTKAEKLTYEMLADTGLPFQTQVPIRANGHSYILDFLLWDKIVLEVDGKYHNTEEQKKRDNQREEILKKCGFQIVRLTNDEIKSIKTKYYG